MSAASLRAQRDEQRQRAARLEHAWRAALAREDALLAQIRDLRARVRAYAKALRIARTLTGWATSSEVDEKIRAALRRPLPAKPRRKR